MDLSTFFGFTATVAAIVGIYLTFIQMQLPFLKRASDPKIHQGRDGYYYLEIRLSIAPLCKTFGSVVSLPKVLMSDAEPMALSDTGSETLETLSFQIRSPSIFRPPPIPSKKGSGFGSGSISPQNP